jgi:hypothetical protein
VVMRNSVCQITNEIHRWMSALSLRSLLSAILVFGVLLGPYSFAVDAHAQHHKSHASHEHNGSPNYHDPADESDHSGVGHALTHCGSGNCTPTFVGSPINSADFVRLSYKSRHWLENGINLRAIHLEADPPVPRGGFSLI